MKFSERLDLLGFSSYEQYLASSHWRGFKEVYCRSGMPVTCAVCGCSRIELHHKTYMRLGDEALADVVPLCRQHHEAVHEKLKEAGKFVESSNWAIAILRGKPLPKVKPKTKKQRKAAKKNKSKRNAKRQQCQPEKTMVDQPQEAAVANQPDLHQRSKASERKRRAKLKKICKTPLGKDWHEKGWRRCETLPRPATWEVADVVRLLHKEGFLNCGDPTAKAWESGLLRQNGRDYVWNLQKYLILMAETEELKSGRNTRQSQTMADTPCGRY